MLSSQLNHVFSNRSGMIRSRPSRTASAARFAIPSVLTNHCRPQYNTI